MEKGFFQMFDELLFRPPIKLTVIGTFVIIVKESDDAVERVLIPDNDSVPVSRKQIFRERIRDVFRKRCHSLSRGIPVYHVRNFGKRFFLKESLVEEIFRIRTDDKGNERVFLHERNRFGFRNLKALDDDLPIREGIRSTLEEGYEVREKVSARMVIFFQKEEKVFFSEACQIGQ
ncbi:MAG: hypothetical protein QG650_773 [Patescibacteria group bacterium]|nr:hypothetical protein [Patescibacteria group bacterium]